jgi:hypothetical protein
MSSPTNEKEAAMHLEAGSNDISHTPKENPAPWYKQTELRKLYICLGFLFLASSTLGYDGSLLNGLQTMNTWQMCKFSSLNALFRSNLGRHFSHIHATVFNQPTGARLGLYSAIPGLGGILSLPLAPYLADGLGRKKGTAFGCACVVAGALIQALVKENASSRDAMFYCGRIIMGFGSNIANATCPLLITEVSHPRHRGKMTTIVRHLRTILCHTFSLTSGCSTTPSGTSVPSSPPGHASVHSKTSAERPSGACLSVSSASCPELFCSPSGSSPRALAG